MREAYPRPTTAEFESVPSAITCTRGVRPEASASP
jgi:hypothetical protein